MLKFLLIPVAAGIFGAAGYFGGQMMAPEPKPMDDKKASMEKEKDAPPVLFKMPLGKVTIQVIRPKVAKHMLLDLDIYINGAKAFESINGAMGRAKLRDATVIAVAQLAETELWMLNEDVSEGTKRKLAEYIVREVHKTYPEVLTARVNKLDYTTAGR